MQSQGNNNYALTTKGRFSSKLSNIDSVYDIYESQISVHSLDKSPINSLEPSPNTCVFSLVSDMSLSNSFSLHSNDFDSNLEVSFQDDMQVYDIIHIIYASFKYS